tara:strand:- start:264 stop:1928 length:1665 start_codon:yes stop_codon:yes gene_type:complete
MLINSIFLKKILGFLYKKNLFLSIRYLLFNFYSKTRTSNYNNSVELNKLKIPFKRQKSRVKFLICTVSGDNFLIRLFDNLFYIYLKCLSVDVKILKCGKTLKACNVSNYSWIKNIETDQSKICDLCTKGFDTEFGFFKKDIINLGDFLDKNLKIRVNKIVKKIDKKNLFLLKGVPNYINENVKTAFIRFNGSSIYSLNEKNISIIRNYYSSALTFDFIFKQILSNNKFNRIICHHGIYIPHGIIQSIIKIKKICSYFWQPGYRKNSVVITKNVNVHKFFPNNKNWNKYEFNKKNKNKITRYLYSRINAEDNWLKFNVKNKPQINFNNKNKTYLLPLNVDWDAVVHFDKSIFKNMFDFLEFTVEYFLKNPNKNLIIRAHPAELLGNVPSSLSVGEFLKNRFGHLPNNIKYIDSFSSKNTYQLAKQSDVIIVYSSKLSIELSSMGMPVIVVGEAWIKYKNLTFDVTTKKEYSFYLNQNISKLKKISKKKKILCLKFAYYYFFIKMFKLNNIQHLNKRFPRFKSLVLSKTNNLVLEIRLINMLRSMIIGEELENKFN